jgi:catechol 2,3-dioxygenase-like lactoylglutathione lyase family enzyme
MMARELAMLGLIVQDMRRSVTFYRRLGVNLAEASETKSHVEVPMGNGMTFFLDAQPTRWDPQFVQPPSHVTTVDTEHYQVLLEFTVGTQDDVAALYAELTGYGYLGSRAPYATAFGMCFAMVLDPDGNTILLSGVAHSPTELSAGN